MKKIIGISRYFVGIGFPVPLIVWGRWWLPFLPNDVGESPVRIGRPVEYDNEFWAEIKNLQNA